MLGTYEKRAGRITGSGRPFQDFSLLFRLPWTESLEWTDFAARSESQERQEQ